jgi:hypothetical protein
MTDGDSGFADPAEQPLPVRVLARLRTVFEHPGHALLFGLIVLVLVTRLNA